MFTYQVKVEDENENMKTYERSFPTYYKAVKAMNQKIRSCLEQERIVLRTATHDKDADWALTYTHKYDENDELTKFDVDGLRFLCLTLRHDGYDFFNPGDCYGDIYVDNQNSPLTIYFTMLYNGDSEPPTIPDEFWY